MNSLVYVADMLLNFGFVCLFVACTYDLFFKKNEFSRISTALIFACLFTLSLLRTGLEYYKRYAQGIEMELNWFWLGLTIVSLVAGVVFLILLSILDTAKGKTKTGTADNKVIGGEK